MSDIFREIDEDVRRDKAAEVWKRYNKLFIVAAVLAVAGTAGWSAWQQYSRKQAELAAARFEAAIEDSRAGKAQDASGALQSLAKDGPAGYRELARFRAAAELGRTDKAAAIAGFDALAADSSLSPMLRGLARLRAAQYAVDTLDRAALKARLEPLLSPAGPWTPNARELLGLAALKAGAYDDAGREFDAIAADPAVPPALKERVEAYLGLVRGGPVKTTP